MHTRIQKVFIRKASLSFYAKSKFCVSFEVHIPVSLGNIYTTISVINARIINTDIVMFLYIYSRFMHLRFGLVEALFSLPKDSLKLQR